MICLEKILVNVLTLSRVVFSAIFTYYIFLYHQELLQITILFAIICATDYFDGILARKLAVCSKEGAIMDVLADFIFIFSADVALIVWGVLPIWMSAVIVWKFIEFWCTSALSNRISDNQEGVFLFDPLGRITAVAFYILPYIIVLMEYFVPHIYLEQIIIGICGLISIVALISSASRIKYIQENLSALNR